MNATLVGQRFEVEIGAVAHGGHCVARHEGRVIFVRHAIPGERAVVAITDGDESSRFLRGDVVEVLTASPDRVVPPCPHARPDACGGCDFQHVSLARQRAMLGDVVAEQLQRLAGIEREVVVERVAGDIDGLGWRTRVRFSATPDRRPGLLMHRSHDVVEIDRCRIAHPYLPDVDEVIAAGTSSAEAVVTSAGDAVVVASPSDAPVVAELVGERRFELHAGDFWQVHPGAAKVLTAAVVDGLDPSEGQRCWDLYSGVGLFSAALGERVGLTGRVLAVEAHGRAATHARKNTADLPQVRVVTDRVDRFVRSRIAQGRLNLVVLDPPRAGAGAAIVRAVAAQKPSAVAYVACDPASLARDVKTFGEQGYALDSLRAFDIFPMTHHVECVAILRKANR